jgi:molybdenum cofactor cytidylyltransferase
MPSIAAMILAAGCSSRMGRCKAILDVGGESAIQHIRGNFRAAGIVEQVIVTGYEAGVIERAVPSAMCVRNSNYAEGGMISSIKVGVATLRGHCDAMLVALVDHPFVASETIRQMVQQWILHPNKIIRPRYDERMGHPVLIPARCADSILALPPEATLKTWMQEHVSDVLIVDVEDPGILMDLDTPADYQEAMAAIGCAPVS